MAEFLFEVAPIIPIPDFLTGEVKSKLAYIDEAIARAEVAQSGDKVLLYLNVQPDDAKMKALDDKVHRVVQALVKGAFKPRVQVLEDHTDRAVPCAVDPMPELLGWGEASRESGGIFALGPLVARLMDYFESRFLELADFFGARPYRFPTLIPARYLEKVNYFSAFPHSLSFVTHLRTDLDAIDAFSEQACCEAEALDAPPGSFARFENLLSPAVCYHLYFTLAGKPLAVGSLAATAVGNCFRYEASNLASLERLWNFTMREIIFVGPKDYVLENREIARQRLRPVFEEIGLAYRVESANDPFFIGEFRKQAAFQSAFQLKFEIRARLPFKDKPGKLATLAVGSYNYHQDFFGRTLEISLPDGSPAHTGCVAFGLERLAFAFLAQYGLDPSGWPAPMRQGAT